MHRRFYSVLLLSSVLVACGGEAEPLSGPSDPLSGGDSNAAIPISTGPEIPDIEVCDQEYSACGYVGLPASFSDTPRQFLVALFSSLPAEGPPNSVLMRIDAPSVRAGERYPVRIHPVLESGEYFIFTTLYVDGGGEFQPVVGTDYVGASKTKLNFDGTALEFGDIDMTVAADGV